MKLQNHLRLLGATALTVFAAACSDDAKQVTAADIATPRLDITNNGALGNFVWHDKNANGIQDDGEPGIPNAPLSFTGPTGSASGNATPTGTYLISGLPAGTYTVCAQLPSGYQYISPNAVGDDREVDSDGAGAQNCYTATLAQGEQRLDVDFGFYNPAELGDYVWYDKNSNGQQDADEVGIPNAMVTLAGPSGPLQAVTDANGKYKFTNLKPGTYEVCVAMPVGYTGVSPHSIGSDVTDSDGEGENNCTDTVLESGDSDLTLDFGFTKSFGSIGDFVWHDKDGDGLQGAGEPGIPGITLTLTSNVGPAQTKTTDANGLYLFDNLLPGTYKVCFGPVSGLGWTGISPFSTGDDETIDSDGQGSVSGQICSGDITLELGENIRTIDFGLFKLGAIGDYVFYDANNNGIQDSGDAPISGATVTITGPNGYSSSQVTNGSGSYLFNNLKPGTYVVCVATPAGYSGPTDDLQGPDRATDSNGAGTPNCDTKELESGETDLKIDFGFVIVKASLGDFVWEDKNANGVQDAGEPGIEGVVVNLTGPSGSMTTTTNEDGGYIFNGLTPGAGYVVCVVPPTGFKASPVGQGGNPAKDSNGSVTTFCAPAVSLAAGEENLTIDFGFYQPVSLGNFVWHDLNANGVQDVGEPGIPGATVSMTGPSGPQSKTTDANGEYTFTDLIPGTYSVCVALPSGYTQYSPANQGGDNAKDSNGPGTGGNCTTAIVPEGTTDMTLDFGFFKLGALGDFVWADGNSNGVQNTGEVGINNVGLKLTGPGGDRTAVTAGGGLYLFDNLRPGTYTVCVPTMPVGFTGTSAAFQGGDATKDSNGSGGASNCATVTLTSGQTDLTIDFGFTKAAVVLGSIGDFVWHDKNGNGVQEAGEEGIGGAVVKITGPNGYASQMNTTAQGNYLFTGLAAGTYVVCVAMPSGYTGITGAGLGGDATKDSNGNGTTTNCSANVVLASGASDLTIDFGFYKLGSIGDYTWYDKNDNGIQNSGEPAFNGVKVTLSGTASGTQTTANGGKYLFTGLKPGTYTVCATVPGGYHAVTANVGNDRAIDSNGEGAQNCSTVVLASGENNLTVDFGFDCGKASPTLASVGDFVWFDKNSNGVQDSGEAGIKNVTVKLTGPNGVSKTTTTNAYGKYLFSDLQPGTYTICVPSVSGYFPTGADKGGYDNKDSDGTGAGNCASVTLTAGEQDLTIDFGFDCKPVSASLQGYVWNDTDKDGIQDGNESGIKGRTVTLSINGTTKTTTTDSYGKYYFTNLNPGIYTVCTAVPTGYVQSPSNVGSNEGVDSDGTGANNCATVTLAAGENKIDPDFGIYCKPTTGAIGSYVWNDENKNGIQDSGEKGISGRTVTLTGAANRTTTTDSYGKYSFTGLNAGTYTVCVAAPSGYQATAADKGDDAVDSDGKPTTQGNCATITLAAGQTNNNIDFGFYCVPVSAKIGGQVWYDKNYNGVQDGGYEVGMGSKTVKISGPGGTKTATTANDGSYSFGNLAAGTYSVCGAIPSGYKASPANKTTSAKDSDGAGSYNCASVTISAGQTITTIDFGFDKKY